MYSNVDDWFEADNVRLAETVNFIGDVRANSVIEIGMKYGFTLENIDAAKKIGIELQNKYLKKSKIKHKVKANLFNMPFKNNSFDVAVFTEVIEHIPEADKALMEISRVTKGKLILSTPNNCTARKIKHRLLGKSDLIAPDHIKEFSWKEVKKMCEAVGFKLTRFKGLGFFVTYRFYPLMKALGMAIPQLSSTMLMCFEKPIKTNNNSIPHLYKNPK